MSDNCPGVTVECVPPSGSTFPVGDTLVICTATNVDGSSASGGFNVTVHDVCIQDDVTADLLVWNSFTGQYDFFACGNLITCSGLFQVGFGAATTTRTPFKLKHKQVDRKVTASVNVAKGTGKARLVFTEAKNKLSIKLTDTNIDDNLCQCP